MRVIMCQEQFHPQILDGSKRTTIRKTARCKPGDVLSLRYWTGRPYRSKQKTLKEVVCLKVSPIFISNGGVGIDSYCPSFGADQIAVTDGFKDFDEMAEWFKKTHGLPFTGFLIEWDEIDEKYADAVEFVKSGAPIISIAAIQRHLKLGYNRALNIKDALQKEGLIKKAKHHLGVYYVPTKKGGQTT